jgi:carbamoyltransferase
MLTLGITGGLDTVYEKRYHHQMRHDAAAVLLKDGEVVAAIEEERLNRIKHTNKAPISAMRFCLDSFGVKIQDVDRVAIHGLEDYMTHRFREYYLKNPDLEMFADAKAMHQRLIKQAFGYDIDAGKLVFVHHHVAHAVSAFAQSGFDESLVLTIDAYGDGISGMLLEGKGATMNKIVNLSEAKSLGRYYVGVIRYLGYDLFEEYKVMGLAPYGDPSRYRRLFKSFYSLLPNGDYVIHAGHLHLLFEAVPQSRREKNSFPREHQDVAAALQESLEEIVFHVLKHYRRTTGQSKLCIAGGVAHNCSLNGKLLYSGLFDDIFVQPASHDAGGALGAALYVENMGKPAGKPARLDHVYWGTELGDNDAVGGELSGWEEFVRFEKHDDIAARAAQLMAEGAVIGWAQGRSEFGPRALGNRSILADPRPAKNKDLINEMVKKREGYRPFAPSVIEEAAADFFEVPQNRTEFPFMVFVLNVRPEKRELLGAITHVDGTARIQTVSKKTNPKYWEVINEFGKLTGVPMLLNTSFNNNAEPIVDSVKDSVVCFLTTKLDYLVVGDYLVSKREVDHASYMNLVPGLPKYARLQRTKKFSDGDEAVTAYEIGNSFDDRYTARVSAEVFELLAGADQGRTLGELLEAQGVTSDERRREIVSELAELWARRVVTLEPSENISATRTPAQAAVPAEVAYGLPETHPTLQVS